VNPTGAPGIKVIPDKAEKGCARTILKKIKKKSKKFLII
jgi:hypothetical protein